ncbi:MAG TPA: hypothetical protein VKT53_07440 [Candidatus Acidoferrum sp.]|nr:hypothetical protein [Candidatus Acidoferrum sp.]
MCGFIRALDASGKLREVLEFGRGLFARGIEKRLATYEAGKKMSAFESGELSRNV